MLRLKLDLSSQPKKPHPFFSIYEAAVNQDPRDLQDCLQYASVNVIHPNKIATVTSELIVNGEFKAVEFLKRQTQERLAGYYQGLGQKGDMPVDHYINEILALNNHHREIFDLAFGLALKNDAPAYNRLLSHAAVVSRFDLAIIIGYIGQGLGTHGMTICRAFLNSIDPKYHSEGSAWMVRGFTSVNQNLDEIKNFVSVLHSNYSTDNLWQQAAFGLARYGGEVNSYHQLISLGGTGFLADNLNLFSLGLTARGDFSDLSLCLGKIEKDYPNMFLNVLKQASYLSYFGVDEPVYALINFAQVKCGLDDIKCIMVGIGTQFMAGLHFQKLINYFKYCEDNFSKDLVEDVFKKLFLTSGCYRDSTPLIKYQKVIYILLCNIQCENLRVKLLEYIDNERFEINRAQLKNSVCKMNKNSLTFTQLQMWKSLSIMTWILQFNSFICKDSSKKDFSLDLRILIASFLVPETKHGENFHKLPSKFILATGLTLFQKRRIKSSSTRKKNEHAQNKLCAPCAVM